MEIYLLILIFSCFENLPIGLLAYILYTTNKLKEGI